jgi:hypothetical protein
MAADTPQTDRLSRVQSHDAPAGPSSSSRPLRMRTNTAEIDSTITHPGSVKINVQGAFIVDQDAGSPNGSVTSSNGGNHDTKDIRLPNHTAVVSHIAVDVRSPHSIKLPLLTRVTDWRLSSQTCLFLPRTQVPRTRRPPKLHELRDRPNRRLRGIHEAAEDQATEAQWLKAGRTMRHGDRRWGVQVLRQDPRGAGRGCVTGR